MDKQHFRKLLIQVMEEKMINQEDLAKNSGLSKSMISRIIKGSRGVSLDSVSHIETALGEKPGYFFRLYHTQTRISKELEVK